MNIDGVVVLLFLVVSVIGGVVYYVVSRVGGRSRKEALAGEETKIFCPSCGCELKTDGVEKLYCMDCGYQEY